MAKKKNVPQVRFAGYSDEWVKYQFGDILDKYEDPVATPHDGYERLGVRSHVKGTFHSYVAPGSELETAQMHRVAADKLLFNITFAWEHAVAITDETDAGKLVSHRFPQFTFVPGMEPKFFRYVVADDKFRYHLWLSSPGGAGRNRVLNIPEMLEYQTYLPQKAEQIQLADWFSNLDVMIVQHQSKLEKLRNIKSSMLEKMFPRNGSCYPEIRFKGFTAPWEQRKFSEFAQRESTFRSSSSDYPSVEYEDVVAEEGRLNKDVRLKDAQKSGIVFDGTQVLYGKLRPYLHNWLNPDFTGVAVGDWWVLRPVGIDKKFLYRLIQTQQFDDVANQSSGSKMPRADWNLVSNTEFIIPSSLGEQKQIAETFDNFDNLITLHQRELGKLLSIKKALLEKMFV